MNRKISTHAWLTAICMLLGLMLAAPAFAGDDDDEERPSACERTAGKMFKACQFDNLDNFNTVVANCLNLSDPYDRRQCRSVAKASRAEERMACRDVREAREDACEMLGEDRYDPDPLLDPAIAFIDPDEVPGMYAPNPWVSIVAGDTLVLQSANGDQETVVVHVTDEVRNVQGVPCRVVADVAVEVVEEDGAVEYEAIEATDDLFAQDMVGDVFYCGEVSRNFEDGVLRDLDGSFEAGLEFAKGGALIRAFPVAGDVHRQEFSLGEAEDIIQYVDLAAATPAAEGGDNPAFPCGADQCLKTFEFAPLEPEATEFKYYLPGIGFVLAVAMEDGEPTGEREELVCAGDSLDILEDPACGIADPAALLETLCKLSPDAFCE